MIDYNETKKIMELMGIDFTESQFAFSLMVSIGIDKYESYKINIIGYKINKVKEDKIKEFEEKVKKDCDILLEQHNIKQLTEYLTNAFDVHVNERLIDTSNYKELTARQLKYIYTEIIRKYSDKLDNASVTDLVKAMGEYLKNFPPPEDGDSFSRHFIMQYPNFNFRCNVCCHEGDAPMGIDFTCKHCGKLYKWSEEDKRYY